MTLGIQRGEGRSNEGCARRRARDAIVVGLGCISIIIGGCSSPIIGVDVGSAASDAFAPDASGPGSDAPGSPIDAGSLGDVAVATDSGGSVDASPPIDASVDVGDPRPPCVIAGGTDMDGDRVCADLDCDDADPAVSPAASEQCTPSPAGSGAVDEDCDTALDEGCAWNFGEPHALTDATYGLQYHYGPQLSADGLRLYFTYFTAAADSVFMVATRASTATRFLAPTPVVIPGLPAIVGRCALSADEMEAVCQAGATGGASDLYQAFRSTPGGSFGGALLLAGVSSAETEIDPFLSRDGSELWFVRGNTGTYAMYLSYRNPGGTFDPPLLVDLPGVSDPRNPHLLPGERTLLFSAQAHLHVAERTAVGAASFTDIRDLHSVLGREATDVWFDARSRELVFASRGSWSGGGTRWHMWRAQVCRDGACPAEPEASCGGGTPMYSPDRFHCYYLTPGPLDQDATNATCASGGGTLATIHSAEEHALVAAAAAAGGSSIDAWIGLADRPTDAVFRWRTSEPYFYSRWFAGQPDLVGSGGVSIRAASPYEWEDRALTAPLRGVCEVSVWPTW